MGKKPLGFKMRRIIGLTDRRRYEKFKNDFNFSANSLMQKLQLYFSEAKNGYKPILEKNHYFSYIKQGQLTALATVAELLKNAYEREVKNGKIKKQ